MLEHSTNLSQGIARRHIHTNTNRHTQTHTEWRCISNSIFHLSGNGIESARALRCIFTLGSDREREARAVAAEAPRHQCCCCGCCCGCCISVSVSGCFYLCVHVVRIKEGGNFGVVTVVRPCECSNGLDGRREAGIAMRHPDTMDYIFMRWEYRATVQSIAIEQ